MEQEEVRGLRPRLKNFLRNAVRVLRVSSKPTGEEYKASLKITSIGIAIIGLIGYLIFVVFKFVGLF